MQLLRHFGTVKMAKQPKSILIYSTDSVKVFIYLFKIHKLSI